jgi:nucleotide-binding universal stress UspA family protein
MATHGRTGIQRWTLGDTANKVARAFKCPVLLIRAKGKSLKSVHMGKILVPLDGSLPSEAVLPYIVDLASKVKSKVILLCVVEMHYHIYSYAEPAAFYGAAGVMKIPYSKEEMKPIIAVAEKYIKSVSAKLIEEGIKAEYEVRVGLPGDEIISAEEKLRPDMVAMSTHGHSGFGRFDHGSIADKVLHAGKTPLLLVRPKKGNKKK